MTTRTFEYGTCQLKDLTVRAVTPEDDEKADGGDEPRRAREEPPAREALLAGEVLQTSKRFWTSLHVRFGFSSNIFKYFAPDEVFQRISEVAPNDRLRYCVQRDQKGKGRLLAVTNPTAPIVRHDDLMALLERYQADEVTYHNGIVRSLHAPRAGAGIFSIAGDEYQNKFVLDTPIDGYGRPDIYLSLLRLVCANGAIAHAPAFRSELSLGKADDAVEYTLVRALEGFNNEEGFCALRQRFEAASRSWASVHEVNKLYRALVRLNHHRAVAGGIAAAGTDGAREPIFQAFHRTTGDLTQLYGLANLDALSVKRQRTLPARCTVYDLLNFASEVATHRSTEEGNRSLQAYIGDLVSNEYDLEGTVDHFADCKDFFIGNSATTDTLARMHRR